MKQLLAMIMLGLCAISHASALDLNTAKSTGLIGERNDGYLGYVIKPASKETQALLKDVNTKRRGIFTASAEKNSISTEQVANRFYQLAVEKTTTGNYYQDLSDNWIRK